MHVSRINAAALLALGLLVVASGSAGAQPPIPSDYSGTVTIGGKPAPDGATIQGKIDTYLTPLVTVKGGKYQFLIVGPLDPTAIGKTVTFLINGAVANETSTFEMGTTKTLNLTIASAPAEPPVVPTATRPPATPTRPVPAASPVRPGAGATPAVGNGEEANWALVIAAAIIAAAFVGWRLMKR
ncbi:MAG: hypothetical protein HYX92_01335 [Chloroflexi bacterium]|nr:hypothetical protein [Chloroflexota bacterium]